MGFSARTVFNHPPALSAVPSAEGASAAPPQAMQGTYTAQQPSSFQTSAMYVHLLHSTALRLGISRE